MPLYEFYCNNDKKKCNRYFEAIVALKDFGKPVKCPYCGHKLKQLMSAPMFRIK